MFDIARAEVKNGATTIDEVVDNMRGGIPDIDRGRLVSSINEVMDSHVRAKSAFEKTLDRVKREARTDKALTEKIDELKKLLADEQLPAKKNKKPPTPTEAIAELREAVADLQSQLAKSKPAIAEKYSKQIKKYTEQLADNGVRLPAPKGSPLEATPELQKLRYERDKLHKEVRHKIARMKPKSIGGKVVEMGNSLRKAMTIGEFSNVGIQSIMTLAKNPGRTADNVRTMFKAFVDPVLAHNLTRQLESDLDIQRIHAATSQALITAPGGDFTQTEEAIQGSIADLFPERLRDVARTAVPERVRRFGNEFVDAFDRSYTTFANLQRYDVAKNLIQFTQNETPTAEELQYVGRTALTLTGRLPIQSLQQHAPVLNAAFFSFNNQVSKIATLGLHPVWSSGGTPAMRKAVVVDYYAKTLGAAALFYGAANLWWGDEDDFSLTFDPRSSDFGKIVKGNVRINPTGGLSQTLTFAARTISGQTRTLAGEVEDLRGPKKKFGRSNFVGQFLRGKLAPAPAQIMDWLSGERIDGSTPTVANTFASVGVPITYQDILDTMTSKDLNIPETLAVDTLAMFGVSVAVYADREKKKKSGKLVF